MKDKQIWEKFLNTCKSKGHYVSELKGVFFCPIEYEFRSTEKMNNSYIALIDNVFVHADNPDNYHLGCFFAGDDQQKEIISEIWKKTFIEATY